MALREYAQRDSADVEYSIQVHRETEDIFRVETDIGEVFGLDEHEVDLVLERAVLAVGALNERFELMSSYNAVTGLRESEAVLLDARLAALVQQTDPERQEAG
jgi:hypothetical protein